MNNLGIFQALIFEPRRGFGELDARPRFWWPLLLLVLLQGGIALWYVLFVDIEWLVDQQVRASSLGANMTDAEIATMGRNAAGQVGVRAALGAVIAGIALPLMLLISALYLLLATKVTGVERSFRHWFALSAWSTLPVMLVGTLLAALALLTASNNQVSQAALQPLSLNELVFHREAGEPGYSLFSSVNLFQLFTVYLTAMGLKVWTVRSWTYCIIVAALPFVLVYGIWAFFALR
ncbi:MAG TPA: YIP1 family protein [Steroidobacteraceae bacterium]|nr:YIP1 family protein [Steroidobacteraceae bacterium]